MKTAEEILKNHGNWDSVGLAEWHKDCIIRAMDEYAIQFMNFQNCFNCNGTGTIFNTRCVNCSGNGKLIILPTITTTGT